MKSKVFKLFSYATRTCEILLCLVVVSCLLFKKHLFYKIIQLIVNQITGIMMGIYLLF